uniref:B30.2/SPRY domain-containing protein n=1 Tax=Electrophorus electricus TaxID=8005 RepID=A0AAY5EH85_ELEEL
METLQDDIIEMAAMGQPFQLGMLYNLRKKVLIPGVSLWSHSEIQKNKSITPKNSTEFSATGSESIEEKANSLKLDTHLGLSLIFEQIKASGSAEYLMATKNSQQHARLTLKYHTTTRFEQLTMGHLTIRNGFQMAELKDNSATHVVIAVLYGANAFFTFHKKVTNEESKEQIKGDLQQAVNILWGLAKESACVSLRLSDRETKELQNMICSFYGDFKLEVNPCTFENAMHVYSTLPSLLGKDGENAVPLRVWLYPLSRLGLTEAPRVIEISSSCSTCIFPIIEDFDTIELKCNHLLNEAAAQTFPVTHGNIMDLKQSCLNYKKHFIEKIGSLLPLVYNGVKEEKDTAALLELHERSPFRSTNINQWLKFKEEELHTVQAILKQLRGIGVELLTDEETENVTCFTFTSLEQAAPFLSQLSEYLTGLSDNLTGTRARVTTDSPLTWLTEEVKVTMRRKLQLFKKLKTSISTKFAVSLEHHKKHPGACIMVYRDDCDGAVCFSPPSKPICSTTAASSHSVTIWYYTKWIYACDVTLDPNTAHTRLSLSEGNRKHRWYPDHPERFDVRKQVVCRESLTGPCYWEAEWSGKAVISVTYKDIRRKGGSRECGFGCNLKSWSLFCSNNSYSVFHNKKKTALSAPCSSNRVGVYLDWAAGTLSFYSVSSLTHTLTRLHTFHSTFTEPLYAGFGVWGSDSSVCVCV